MCWIRAVIRRPLLKESGILSQTAAMPDMKNQVMHEMF